MPISQGYGRRLVAQGIYRALSERIHARHDRGVAMGESAGYLVNAATAEQVAAVDAGEPVTVLGRDLRGHSMPAVMLRRHQFLDTFVVAPDDSIEEVSRDGDLFGR